MVVLDCWWLDFTRDPEGPPYVLIAPLEAGVQLFGRRWLSRAFVKTRTFTTPLEMLSAQPSFAENAPLIGILGEPVHLLRGASWQEQEEVTHLDRYHWRTHSGNVIAALLRADSPRWPAISVASLRSDWVVNYTSDKRYGDLSISSRHRHTQQTNTCRIRLPLGLRPEVSQLETMRCGEASTSTFSLTPGADANLGFMLQLSSAY